MRLLRLEKSNKLIEELSRRGATDLAQVEGAVRKIVEEVRKNGDRSLRKIAVKWDGLGAREPFKVSEGELKAAWQAVDRDFKAAIKAAASNLRQFCEWQMPRSWSRPAGPGVRIGQVVRPLDSVGCYVPGGRYPLPSTVLMTVIPAKVAGVKRIVVTSPKPAKETMAAAYFLGVDEMYRIGGAQAIGALAYGTESVDAVTKIVGPGNIYVTTAKKLVAFDCGIDMLAGPTEALIVSAKGNAIFIAADLVAQAEHDPETLLLFLTTSHKLADAVRKQVDIQAAANPIARKALKKRGYIFVARDMQSAMEAANRIAAEHITVDDDLVNAVTSAGSVFVGDYSAQAFGDYASGPNHVLPTGGLARVRGGLSVMDFLKTITVQRVSRAGLQQLASIASTLAKAEGLTGHANSVTLRCGDA